VQNTGASLAAAARRLASALQGLRAGGEQQADCGYHKGSPAREPPGPAQAQSSQQSDELALTRILQLAHSDEPAGASEAWHITRTGHVA